MKQDLFKIFGNIAVAFLAHVFFLALELPKIIRALQKGYYWDGHEYYPKYTVSNFEEILSHAYPYGIINETNLPFSLFLVVLILTPFAFYKEYQYDKGLKLSFLKKWIILSLPFCVASFLMFAAYMYGASAMNIINVFIILPISFALYLNILLYLLIDLWVEKKYKLSNNKNHSTIS